MNFEKSKVNFTNKKPKGNDCNWKLFLLPDRNHENSQTASREENDEKLREISMKPFE